jgi:hypothetical protein
MGTYLEAKRYPLVEGKTALYIAGLRTIPLKWCDAGCRDRQGWRGFRFPWRGADICGPATCCFQRSFTLPELERLAPDCVRRCPVCGRCFVQRCGRHPPRRPASTCPAEECRLAWAHQHPSLENTCHVCGQPCLTKFAVSTQLMPALYPKRLAVGGEFCLCPGPCLATFRAESRGDLRAQAEQLLAGAEGANGGLEEALRNTAVSLS